MKINISNNIKLQKIYTDYKKTNNLIKNTKLLLKRVNRYLNNRNNSSNSNDNSRKSISMKNKDKNYKMKINKSLTDRKFKKRQMYSSFKDLNHSQKKVFLNEIDIKDKNKDSFNRSSNINSLSSHLIYKKFFSLNKIDKSYSEKKIVSENFNEKKQIIKSDNNNINLEINQIKRNNKNKNLSLLLKKDNNIINTERTRRKRKDNNYNNIKILSKQKNENYKNNIIFFNNRYNSDDSLHTINNGNNDRDNNILFVNRKSFLKKEELYNEKIGKIINKINHNQNNSDNLKSKCIEKKIGYNNIINNLDINNNESKYKNIINGIYENIYLEKFDKIKNDISLTYNLDF